MRRFAIARLALLLLPLACASCASFKKVNLYSVPEEMAVGEVFSSQVEGLYPVLHDPQLDWYLNHRGRMLADLSDRRDLPYEFNVIDSPELNAFAIPGGHIYLNLGMIEAAGSEAELLGVVGHEIGHVIARHSMKQMSQSNIVAIVGTLALNQYPNQWAALAANLFGAGGFLKMSRDAEREADAIGFELLIRAGYDPRGMRNIYGSLLKKYDEEPGLLDKLFSTHPPTRERIENLAAMEKAHNLAPNLVQTTPTFERVYDHMLEKYYSEAGRRRWKEVLRDREDEEHKKKDRLPWDKKSDEEKAQEEAKDRERRAKKRPAEAPAPDAETGPPPDVETSAPSEAPAEVAPPAEAPVEEAPAPADVPPADVPPAVVPADPPPDAPDVESEPREEPPPPVATPTPPGGASGIGGIL